MHGLVTYVHRGPSSLYQFSGRQLTFLISLVMESALLGNVLAVCTLSFSCSALIPTISYTGCLRGHDRVFAFICTCFALTIPLTVLGLKARFHGAVDCKLMTYAGLSCAFVLPGIGLIDEVNGLYVVSLTHVHTWLSLLLLTLAFCFAYCVYSALETVTATLSYEELKWKARLHTMYYASAVLALFTILQWHFAYTTYSNSLVNENIEALCEWTLISIGVFQPCVYAQFIPNYVIALGVQAKAGQEDT